MKARNLFKKRNRARITPSNLYDDLYDSFDDNWQLKADRLRARRWRKIKHQLV